MATHELRIIKVQNGCDVLDPGTNSNRTVAKQKEKVRWENTLNEAVTITFTSGSPLEVDTIQIKADQQSKKYEVLEDPNQTKEIKYPYTLSCNPPIAGPIIVVPPPPPPDPPKLD